ncbi:hypothetical protein [Nocardia australiensis]|uniref:hypothetical protein n=1 Tax=Nocardia australiensis TaxID=2887191 RepID=UPI001D13CB0E|nr:hypothetical protein [Nocardia australiensis]
MDAERNSPYWDAIVGDNWPTIAPAEWRALEHTARDAAAVIDIVDDESRRRAFDDHVRASAGLQPAKEDMRRQSRDPQAFADALDAAADTFGDFANLVYRTRNQILDIVDRATGKAQSAQRSADEEKEESDAEAARARIPGILGAARREVEDVVHAAMAAISPQNLRPLDRIGHKLGVRPPWPTSHRDEPNVAPHRHHSWIDRLQRDLPDPRHLGDGLRRRMVDDGLLMGVPLEELVRVFGPEPISAQPMSPDADTGVVPGGGGAGDAALVARPVPAAPAAHNGAPAGAESPPPNPDDHLGAVAAGSPSRQQPMATGHAAGIRQDGVDNGDVPEIAGVAARSGTDDLSATAADPNHAGALPDSLTVANEAVTQAAAMQAAAMASTLPMGMPPTGASVAPTAATTATAASVSASASAPGSVSAPPSQARPTATPFESRGGAEPPKGPITSAAASASANVAGPVGKPQAVTRTEGQKDNAGTEHDHDRGNAIRDVVGAAMTSAAAPSFVLGDRVDGDLVLARTILSSLLAAVEEAAIGVGWAVSVMRHSTGLGAFVTSNEGRGWLPAGLYLPREVSIPWVWEVADEAGWEGLADPARVLAEFAIAWGRKSGAGLSALVSSEPLDPSLRQQLRDVPMAGEIAASAAMDFSRPASGRVDRLGLVGAPALLERATALPDSEIGARCVNLAIDAHVRVGKGELGSPEALGAPRLRQRILTTIRRGQVVSEDLWAELRDTDDLVAASTLARRVDVSGVALGELRSERVDGRSASELTAVRGMMFERRCDELVLLLENSPSRQVLRDVTYAHAQIVGHPSFTVPEQPGQAAGRVARRPTITAGPPS